MTDWKQKFDQDTLDRGRASYLNRRVDGLKENSGGYEAAVLGRERIEVSVNIHGGRPGRMKCACPAARGGRNCEHMAALLYAVEGRNQALLEKRPEAEIIDEMKKAEAELREQEEKKKAEEQRRKRERQAARWRRLEEAKLTQEEKKAATETKRREEEAARLQK